MLNKKTNIHRRFFALMLAALLLLTASAFGCAGGKTVRVPEGLTREQAALYVAIANVCPIGENNTKAEYLTFRIEGWSFDEIPPEVLSYIKEYSASGNAALMQFDDAALEQMGLIKKGDGDFYETYENVYAEGKGKIFTFTLGEGQSTDAGEVKVSVKSYKSDRDTSGFDVELKYEAGGWSYVRTSGAWNHYQFATPAPVNPNDPQK